MTPLLSTPTSDTTFEENDNSIESEANPEDDSVILAQLAMDKPIILLTPSANTLNAEDPPTQEAKNLPFKVTRSHKTPQPLKPCLFLSFLL